MRPGLDADEAAKIYRLECPHCAGSLSISPLMASERGEPERIIDELLTCRTCRLAWTLKQVTEALIRR